MTDRTELRRLAEAAASGPWWTSDKLKCHPDLELSDDAAYIAAASPDVVLGLLASIAVLEGWYATASGQRNAAEAERDQWKQAAEQNMLDYQKAYRECLDVRDAVRRLAGALVNMMDDGDRTDWDVAEDVLADPVVRRIVGGG